MIYFLQATEGGPVKIGHSADVDARRAQLETHYGKPLALLGTLPGGRDEERDIHGRFAEHRIGRTEQFRPVAELMAFIGRPLLVAADPEAVEAMESIGNSNVIIHLKGSTEYAQWFERYSEDTHIAKTALVRLALAELAKQHKRPAPPKR